MLKVISVEQMREIERAADAGGLTYASMMENAGRSVAQHILQRSPEIAGRRVAILVGTGNLGGDGLVVGHYLAEAGAQVAAYLLKEQPADDVNLTRLQGHGALIAVAGADQRGRVLRNLMGSADVVVDALLGTGFRLPLEGPARELLATAGTVLVSRESRPLVVSVDCPSGLDCDTGDAAPEALPADLTVTLGAAIHASPPDASSGVARHPGPRATPPCMDRTRLARRPHVLHNPIDPRRDPHAGVSRALSRLGPALSCTCAASTRVHKLVSIAA